MSKLYTISEASKILNVTSETLRHYDRINLVKSTFIDLESGYRYYSKEDIIKLSTIKTLRIMDLSLEEIKEILSYNYLNKASNKINDLNIAINKINRAKNYYENKLKESTTSNKMFIQKFDERVIILSKTMSTPSLENCLII